jgi:CheY-like chemotaxis protein
MDSHVARRSLLVVEDDANLRTMFRTARAMSGYEVREAANGLEALRRIDTFVPDLIVLDLIIPVIDGRAVLQEIRAQADTRHIPVIVVTGSSEPLADLSVKCIMRKPVAPDEIVAKVQECLDSPPAFW